MSHSQKSRRRLRWCWADTFAALLACLLLCGCNANLEGKVNPLGFPCGHDYDCESDVCAVMFSLGAPIPAEGPKMCSQRCPDGTECVAGWQCLQPQDPSAEKTCYCTMGDEICDGKDNNCDAIVDNEEPANNFCLQKTGLSSSICYNGTCTGSNCTTVTNCIKGWSCDLSSDLVTKVCTCKYSAEICDGLDNDCNRTVDDATAATADCVTKKGPNSKCVNGACT